MVAFRNTDPSGRTTGLLLRCVLYCLLALGLIIVDKRYDHLGKIRRILSIAAYPVQVAVASPFEGWDWLRESVTTRDALRGDKAKLEAELRLAQFRLQRYDALEAETQRLRGLRDSTAQVTDRFVVGDVMDIDLDPFRERVPASACSWTRVRKTAYSSGRRCWMPAASSDRSRAWAS
jgi:rod shape-determining protein MreC